MSFALDINALLQNNPELSAYLTDADNPEVVNIFSYNLPDDFPVGKRAIVFTYKKDEGLHVLEQKNVLEDYILYVVCLGPSTTVTEEISRLVRLFVDDHEDETILDVTFEDDLNGKEQEKERFYKSLEYHITYNQ